MEKITLFHGSNQIVELPELSQGNIHNDYGQGFYCTRIEEMAREWACKNQKDGFVNRYVLDMDGLHVLNLSDGNHTVLNWIAILLKNRTFRLRSPIAIDAKEYLIEHFAIDTKNYDIIVGYRADDSYFSYAKSFLNNTISVRRLSEALRLGHLGKQVVLISEKAFDALEFVGYETASAEKYFSLRKERNEKARLQFLSDRSGSVTPDDIYLADLLRGGVSKDDPRLQ